MQDDRHRQHGPPPTAATKQEDAGRPVRRRLFGGPQTVEAYLRANNPPRYMRRLRQIEDEYRAQRERLKMAYRALEAACGHDAAAFASRWLAQARGWRFEVLNDLISEHNAWYPAEANLPMDPRTGDYVTVHGASYRRVELGPDWVLEHFPPDRGSGTRPLDVPRRAPREPGSLRPPA